MNVIDIIPFTTTTLGGSAKCRCNGLYNGATTMCRTQRQRIAGSKNKSSTLSSIDNASHHTTPIIIQTVKRNVVSEPCEHGQHSTEEAVGWVVAIRATTPRRRRRQRRCRRQLSIEESQRFVAMDWTDAIRKKKGTVKLEIDDLCYRKPIMERYRPVSGSDNDDDAAESNIHDVMEHADLRAGVYDGSG